MYVYVYVRVHASNNSTSLLFITELSKACIDFFSTSLCKHYTHFYNKNTTSAKPTFTVSPLKAFTVYFVAKLGECMVLCGEPNGPSIQ